MDLDLGEPEDGELEQRPCAEIGIVRGLDDRDRPGLRVEARPRRGRAQRSSASASTTSASALTRTGNQRARPLSLVASG